MLLVKTTILHDLGFSATDDLDGAGDGSEGLLGAMRYAGPEKPIPGRNPFRGSLAQSPSTWLFRNMFGVYIHEVVFLQRH